MRQRCAREADVVVAPVDFGEDGGVDEGRRDEGKRMVAAASALASWNGGEERMEGFGLRRLGWSSSATLYCERERGKGVRRRARERGFEETRNGRR